MIVLRVHTVESKYCWIVTHNLTFEGNRNRNFRPIHAFTFLSQHLIKGNKAAIFNLCMSLENKLFAVKHHLKNLFMSITGVGDPIYKKHYVKEYFDQQNVISDLEAFLNSIYASLEISAQINKKIYPHLPMGFRKQSQKFDMFSFTNWQWLPRFFDLRSEMTHFGSPIPIVEAGKFIIEFTQTKRLEFFKKGKHEISFSEMVKFSKQLFNMLDSWSTIELEKIDPNLAIDCYYEDNIDSPLKYKKIKAELILDMVKNYKM